MMFKCLTGQSDIPEYKRLAGITKKNWVENMRRVQRLLLILAEADAKGIKVVILKGMAISFFNNDFASRVMGDTDLLVRRSDQEEMLKILLHLGFEPRFRQNCTHRELTSDIFTDAFVDASGNIVDVHITDGINYFHNEIWKNSVTILYQGQSINIPQDSHILLHSLKHGLRGVAASDLMQTVLDFISLKNRVDMNQLMEESFKWRLHEELSQINNFLGIETSPDLVASKVLQESLKGRLTRFFVVRKDREISLKMAAQASKNPDLYRYRYLLWIWLSGLRPLEQIIIEKNLGFIRNFQPVEKSSASNSLGSFNSFKTNIGSHYEIRFGIEGVFNEILVESYGYTFSPHLLFLNGNLAGIIEPNSSLVVRVKNLEITRYEVSIRQPYGRCYHCSQILENSVMYFQ